MVLSVSPDSAIQARAESAKQRVYRRLKADIVRGVFDMGERLNEGQLSVRYDVGKTPVREALGVLQQEGLVEVLPRVGYLTSRVTFQDVDDIFDLRKIVEGAAAEKAAAVISQETLERLEQLPLEFRAGDRDSYLRFLEENLEFHCIIAETTGNRRLAGVVAGLLEQMQRLVILRLDISASLEDLVGEHANLLTAFRDRDSARARLHMVTDITNTHQAALDSLKKLMANRHI